ncbi:hypothetical protein [Paenibacillus sp. R14(2021)]|uniref:hypothetical protein n=1 Tax=Paenibacillus sp. R14(2021) TaxID=2859228 RepID=UPI001C613632|nr:hypothetical protein [Paenibacillus sp. R14(2021)]
MYTNERHMNRQTHSASSHPVSQPHKAGAELGSQNRLLALQRMVGNQAVVQMMKKTAGEPIQRVGSGLMSIGAISLDLASGDPAKADILRKLIESYGLNKVRAAVLDVPGAFTGDERAEMTMQFLEQPGASTEMAVWAGREAGDGNERYLQLLKLYLRAQEAAGSAVITEEHMTVIRSCAEEIGDNKGHLKYVVSSVLKAENLALARKKLDEVKKFNFNEKLLERVDAEVEKYADFDKQSKLFSIDKEESDRKKQAFDEQYKPASEERKVKKEKSDFKRNKLLLAEQERLAKPKKEEIALDAVNKRAEVNGPGYEKVTEERKEQYAAYYKAAKYHPQADKVLGMTSNLFADALQIMEVVMLGKDGEAFALNASLSIDKLLYLCELFAPPQIGQLLQQLKPDGLAPYLDNKIYISFLLALFNGGVPGAVLLDLSKCVGKFFAYCTDQAVIGHLITLVQTYTVNEIVKLLDAAPPYKSSDVNKMQLLVTLSPKANTAKDLLAALAMCEKAEWDAARVLLEQQAWGNGLDASALEQAIQANMMNNVTKAGNFSKWVRLLGVLVEKNYYTITYSDVKRLKIKMPTNEVVCTVSGNGMNETFYVHGHPGAEKAKVGSPNASDIHLKPETGPGILDRLKREQIPSVIWNGIGESKRKALTK